MSELDTILAIAAEQLPTAGIDCLLIGGFAVHDHGCRKQVEALRTP